MAGRCFIADSPSLADIRWLAYDTAETFVPGAALIIASDGQLEECGADPVVVAAVSLDYAGRGPGFSMADDPQIVTGRGYKASVIMTSTTQVWMGRLVNGGTDPFTPTETMIGEEYGIKADADGVWAVDQADTTNVCVVITRVDIPAKYVWFRFLPSAIPGA